MAKYKKSARTRRIISVVLALALVAGILFGIISGIIKGVHAIQEKSRERKEYKASIQYQLDKMSLEEKVAQMILSYQPEKDFVSIQKKYQFGGYVFFAKYFKNNTPEQVVADMAALQDVSKHPMILAVDEEGGKVNRISKYPQYRDEPFASGAEVYHGGGWDGVLADSKEKAMFLKILGLNTNLAPVADVPYDEKNYIFNRSFSTDPEQVSQYVETVLGEYNDQNLLGCLKHFPGYGDAGNSHLTVIEDTRDQQVLDSRDSQPFQAGIAAGAPMIMVSHSIVDAYDAKNPASLSKAVHSVLRDKLGFQGVIVTDGLEMGGVTKFINDPAKVAVMAVKAGNDLLCTGTPIEHYEGLLAAVQSGNISEERINESVTRILEMKQVLVEEQEEKEAQEAEQKDAQKAEEKAEEKK